MSDMCKSLPSLPPLPLEHWYSSPNHPLQTQQPPPLPQDDTGPVVFTRQLWQRNMPDRSPSEQGVLNKSHTANAYATHNNAGGSSRRTSSTTSSRSQHHSPSPSHGSKTPLTPEESPPFRSTRKRNAGIVEREDKAIDRPDISPAHTDSSADSSLHVCICQPDPKIPRPRNAFILYRQHHQANVVAQYPGLANPEISKIIGEQWQNQASEVKNKWKQLAEEEKIRHQQQYPAYRYQPKRNNRRNTLTQDSSASGEKIKCQKCGGRTTTAPSTPYSAGQSTGVSPASVPPTPRSAITPVGRTLPVLKELSLQSPAARRASKFHPVSDMSPHHTGHMDERDEVGSLSPDMKRRKYNYGNPESVARTMPPRYGAGPLGTQAGPGTPFPFSQPQMPPPPRAYSLASTHLHRESLPGLRGVVTAPAPLGPPPRPSMGYQQHRLSQGRLTHDRSLTLPPLQTSNQPNAHNSPSTAGKTAEEQIMNINFRYKIKVLCQVAPPASRRADLPRGPLVAVEGDSSDAVKELTEWLRDTLSKDDLAVKLMDGPNIGAKTGKIEAMVQYHQLAADWLDKSHQILQAITTKTEKTDGDATMTDATSAPSSAKPTTVRIIDENYDSSDDNASSEDDRSEGKAHDVGNNADTGPQDQQPSIPTSESMDLDKTPTAASYPTSSSSGSKPILLIPNYSLHTSNAFALRIPIGPSDPYSPNDHWQWTATQWRGIIGPDLTIYVRDASVTESVAAAPVDVGHVESRADVGVITVVRRVKGETTSEGGKAGDGEIEPTVLRRLGFEVSEWVRGFSASRD